MKRLAINTNGNTITSFAGELNLTGVGDYLSLSLYIYIYIYIRVCVCVCVCLASISSLTTISLNNMNMFCLRIFIYVILSYRIDFMVSSENC